MQSLQNYKQYVVLEYCERKTEGELRFLLHHSKIYVAASAKVVFGVQGCCQIDCWLINHNERL